MEREQLVYKFTLKMDYPGESTQDRYKPRRRFSTRMCLVKTSDALSLNLGHPVIVNAFQLNPHDRVHSLSFVRMECLALD